MSHSPIATPSPWSERLQALRDRLRQHPEVPEDSIKLRVLVQALVSVGIASVVVAAAGVTESSWLSLVAIPLSAIGGYWSWQSRNRANVAVKFVIAFGMLMALGIFLVRLVGEGGDTRIRLAELLIHLQVLHSFDMPRRKDLGYSMVIGLILLGVAATVSQTLTFAPVLLLFLAIALPGLMLDYRSRLGLKSYPGQKMAAALNVKQVAWLLSLVLVLGLLIFALLPRLPGYQVRNFPVSDTINFQGDFSGDQILNPGYAAGGEDTAELEAEAGDSTVIQGKSPVEGPGAMNDGTYYGLSQRINQNLRGSMAPQVVMRVRSQAPGFWRMLAFDHYTGQGWEISRAEEVQVLKRSSFSYQTYLPAAAFKARKTQGKSRYREVIQTYTIINELPNLIPSLYQADQLYFPTQEVAIDAEGSLRSPVPLSNGLTFTVISEVPYRDRTPLRSASTDYADDVKAFYLQVPEAIQPQVQQLTEDLLATAAQPLTDPYEKALFLAQALKQNYTLQANLPFFDEGEDLVEAFLFRHEGGYGDHFSTVLTVMLRSIGIPARLTTGFAPGQFNPFTGYYVVNNTDAYAITEVYFPEYGWFAFDPIPGHELIPPSIRDNQTFGVLRQFWNWVAGWLPSPVTSWLNGVLALIFTQLSRLLRFFSSGLVGILAGLLTATGLAFLAWLGWQGWRRWRRRARLQTLPPVERTYQHMLLWLADQGYPKHPAQTPLEYAIALGHNPQFPHGDIVMQVVQAYMAWRYGDRPQDVDSLNSQVRALRQQTARQYS